MTVLPLAAFLPPAGLCERTMKLPVPSAWTLNPAASISFRIGETGPLPGLAAGRRSASGEAVSQAPAGFSSTSRGQTIRSGRERVATRFSSGSRS